MVREVHSVKVAVLGAVRMPGHYEVKSAATVLELIARAQGLNEFADRGRIVVLRQNGADDHTYPLQLSQGRRRVRTGQLLRAPRRHHRRSLREAFNGPRPAVHQFRRLAGASRRRDLPAPRAARRRDLRDGAWRRDLLRALPARICIAPRRWSWSSGRSRSRSSRRRSAASSRAVSMSSSRRSSAATELIELIERFNLYPEMRKRAGLEEVLTQARNDIWSSPPGRNRSAAGPRRCRSPSATRAIHPRRSPT